MNEIEAMLLVVDMINQLPVFGSYGLWTFDLKHVLETEHVKKANKMERKLGILTDPLSNV